MNWFDSPYAPLEYSTTYIPPQRVYASIITGFIVILADAVVFAALFLKRSANTRKDDVVIGANVALDVLTAIRNVSFGINTLVTYAEHDECKKDVLW